MFEIGAKVTRKGSSKIWEIAKVEKASDQAGIAEDLLVAWYGSLDANLYQLKNIETGKISRNVLWSEDKLTAI